MRRYICLAMLPLTVLAGPGYAKPKETPEASVLATVQAFSDARARFDSAALGRLLTPDYVEVSPRGEIDRRSEVLGFYTPDKASPAPPMTYRVQDVRRFGDTAIVIGDVEYTIPTPTGEKVKRTVRATYVERRVGGRWLIASSQFTGVAPPQPAH